ncbi:hypothetical protein [Leptolyngbya sp. FACHB-261]|uniref:hypothetical protein n=1 Tax=Leptolyngbya sp. FACHB-261 TaxID=2692806 RepID=UPI00168921CD|nr:hypothetical protein [Leptolyngbya sp. FACHB-261]MBD2105131.1 hypothetical protein [Leptolyngbya sp. FACHB-261]
MAIIALKAWYLRQYEPLPELERRPHDLRLSKQSLLKSGLRADFLDDSAQVRTSEWFQSYLQGDLVEFYIEGSGGYVISNIDLISHEIYFTKREVLAHLDPTLFFCYQTQYPEASETIRSELQDILASINQRSRLALKLEESHRLTDGPTRLESTVTRKLRRSLLFIADVTPISQLNGEPPLLLPSPQVTVEVGYALECKRPEQILLLQLNRKDLPGQFPFDLPIQQRLNFANPKELHKFLPAAIETQLSRFNLLT